MWHVMSWCKIHRDQILNLPQKPLHIISKKFLEVDERVQPGNAIANLLNERNLKQELPTNQYQIIADNNFQRSQCAQTLVWQSVLVLGHDPCTMSILVPYIVPNAGLNPITYANDVLTFLEVALSQQPTPFETQLRDKRQ